MIHDIFAEIEEDTRYREKRARSHGFWQGMFCATVTIGGLLLAAQVLS